jgi:CelD/BcsL family acetyltransferase involved in cellulose biosynthesis
MKIRLFADFGEAEHAWKTFQNDAYYHSFQQYEWQYNWYHEFGQALKIDPYILLVEDEVQGFVLLLPLGIQRKRGLHILTWLGGRVTDYHAPLVQKGFAENATPVAFYLIWKQVLQMLPPFDAIHFKKQPGKIGDQANPFLELNVQKYAVCYSTELTSNWNEFYQYQVKGKIRADSRRQKKRLGEFGKLQFLIAKSPEEIKLLTDKMIDQKRRRYEETNVADMFADNLFREFYHRVAEKMVPNGNIHLSALKVGDTFLAIHLGLVSKQRFYYLMPTFEGGAWRKFSAGRLLMEYLIEWCIQNEIRTFDFTIGAESYKQDWCNQSMDIYEYLQAKSAKGILYVFLQKVKRKALQSTKMIEFAGRVKAVFSQRIS